MYFRKRVDLIMEDVFTFGLEVLVLEHSAEESLQALEFHLEFLDVDRRNVERGLRFLVVHRRDQRTVNFAFADGLDACLVLVTDALKKCRTSAHEDKTKTNGKWLWSLRDPSGHERCLSLINKLLTCSNIFGMPV